MDDKSESMGSPDTPPVRDKARRKFVKKSGGVALAAPAVVLLLSAHGKEALATKGHYTPPKSDPPPKGGPKKTLLDP